MHLWDPSRIEYPWLINEPAINHTHWVDEYRAATGDHPRVAVFVQADAAASQSMDEVDAVGEIAEHVGIAGIVAFAPVDRGGDAIPWLERLCARPLVKGVRFLLQDLPKDVMDDGRLRSGIKESARLGLTFDICIRRHQMAAAASLVAELSEVRFVLDHLGKPRLDGDSRDAMIWREDLSRLAALPNLHAKISGLATETVERRYEPRMIVPYIEHALEVFGPSRLMLGSDWPVSTLATSYEQWWEAVDGCLSTLSADENTMIRGVSATRFYRLSAS